jgi:periplasmic divalent cation tolerance protein
MKSAKHAGIVLVTAPNLAVARRLAKAALEARLVACANLLPRIESHYWWQGKLEEGNEVLIIFKTTRRRLTALEKLVLEKHPYDTPEFIFLPVDGATEKYLRWWIESVG